MTVGQVLSPCHDDHCLHQSCASVSEAEDCHEPHTPAQRMLQLSPIPQTPSQPLAAELKHSDFIIVKHALKASALSKSHPYNIIIRL